MNSTLITAQAGRVISGFKRCYDPTRSCKMEKNKKTKKYLIKTIDLCSVAAILQFVKACKTAGT